MQNIFKISNFFLSLLFILALIISETSVASNSTGKISCFRDHMLQAMKINGERRPLYSKLTNGHSEAVSDALINFEKRLVFYQNIFNYDRWAQKFEDRGIHVSCDSVVPMATTPAYRGTFAQGALPAGAPASQARASDVPRLWAAFTLHDDARFQNILREILARLDSEHRTDCLYRHFLESMARIAALEPLHSAKAKKVGMSSPRWIHRQMIFGHLIEMPVVISIDAKAQALNAAGVAIVCGDIPHIPIPSQH